jgi:phosphoserine aminotransferase
MKPVLRPKQPFFSSGPCVKRPGWTPAVLADACLGRSHRSKAAQAKLKEALDRTRRLLEIPADYRIGIVPASDTGAVEMALWSLLGPRGVDILAWESFGLGWVNDVVKELKLTDVRRFESDYGLLPDLEQVDFSRDVVFVWNGTTSGVKVPDGDWIPQDRQGLTLCDATSAVFAMDIPWPKLDVATFSWQKALGGEAAHGMLILSPRAVGRLESYTPPWPIPKIFRLTKGGRLIEEIFAGATINTPSMLCVEDYLDTLKWAEAIGGLPALIGRSERNLQVLATWVAATPWIEFLATRPEIRSCTSVCFTIVDPWFMQKLQPTQIEAVNRLCKWLEDEAVAYDIGAHRDAPPGLRLWAGATVEAADLQVLLPWLEWAFERVKLAEGQREATR